MELKSLSSLPPSEECFACRGCCVFLSSDSAWIPYFRKEEIEQAVATGISKDAFPSQDGSRIAPVVYGDVVRCPALNPDTHACAIYAVRPLDCFIYPFVLVWDKDHNKVFLGLHEGCPFVFTQNAPLAEGLVRRGAELAQMLQTSAMIKSLSAHPKMIMTLQPDTLLLTPLDPLTQAMMRQWK